MMIDVEGAWDLLKGVPVTLWMLSSVMLLSALSPACAVHEFTAHRMQQFDLYGNQYGESYVLKGLSLLLAVYLHVISFSILNLLCRFPQCVSEHGGQRGGGKHAEQEMCCCEMGRAFI